MKRGSGGILSYLLFERRYTRALMRIGFDDAMNRRNAILRFLGHAELSASNDDKPSAIRRTVECASIR